MIGETVSHYRILEKLGEGGMGVVYLAEDTHLGRRVAVKFLTSTDDHNYRARFLREARAVSHLSHPCIAIIHDYGETSDGQPFIVMEYVKGEPLNELLSKSAVTITQALSIAEAVAEALGAAHEQGIIHRDIKPSNVLVSGDARVKVLDFGLVKQMHEESVVGGTPDALTLPALLTSSNVVVGTPLYLSPEQALGGHVDARSDLFALGALLYESLTGKPPFSGASVIEIGAQILHFNPTVPSALNKHVPPELDRTVLKALAKNPADRYQSAEEFLVDLRAARSLVSEEGQIHQTQRIHTSRVTHSSALKSISETLRRPRVSIGFFLVGMGLVALGLWFLFKLINKVPEAPFQRMKFAKLTTTGKSRTATISPDGKYVVYVEEESGRQSLWLRHVPTQFNRQIIPPIEGEFAGVTFTPDSNYVYYVQKKNDVGTLFRMSFQGGNTQKIISGVDSHPSVSPDGQSIAFIRQKTSGDYFLIVARSDGSNERQLATRTRGEFFSLFGATAWSPGGKTIACVSGSFSGGYHMSLVEVQVQDGAEKPIPSQNWFQITRVTWRGDGRGLFLTGSDQSVSPFQIWYVSYPEGKVRRITNDPIDYNSLALTADSKTLVTLQVDRLTNIWVMPSGDTGHARQVTSGVGHTNGLSFTPEGKILYSSVTTGDLDIFLAEPDGSNKTQLTSHAGANYHPVMSPDSRYIVLASNRTGPFNLWRTEADGSNLKQLTSGGTDLNPSFSPDSKWVVYESSVNGVSMIWKVSIEGGAAVQLTTSYSSLPAVSPDGKAIACRYLDKRIDARKIALITFDGGQLIKTYEIPIHYWQRVRWTTDGLALTYIDTRNGVANIWSQPLDGGQPMPLTDFKDDLIFSYDWSRDGRQLACERGVETSDVVLITDLE